MSFSPLLLLLLGAFVTALHNSFVLCCLFIIEVHYILTPGHIRPSELNGCCVYCRTHKSTKKKTHTQIFFIYNLNVLANMMKEDDVCMYQFDVK